MIIALRPARLALGLLLPLWLLAGCEFLKGPRPPHSLLQSAKKSLERAAAAGALRYAEQPYRDAEWLIQKGWMEMARQNGRISLFRNFHRADSLLRRAMECAEEGMRTAQDSLSTLEARSLHETKALEGELQAWRDALDGSLIIYNAERFWSDAELHLKTAHQLARAREYQEAHNSIIMGRKALGRLGAILADRAEDEATYIKVWRRWVEEAVARSRAEETSAVVVDKAAHKTYLIRNGTIAHTYSCELGYNSARPKLFAGDGATPEGVYHIIKVKPGNSKYYKALLLDYPNDADKRRFAENKRRGIISRHAGIGRLIEIHGDGGNGRDWTDGCVALDNDDLDQIMQFVTVGTPVVIVRRYDGWK